MGLPIAIVLTALGVIGLSAYNNTPHFIIGPMCGPITVLSYTFTVDVDCMVTSHAELLTSVAFFILAALAFFFGRGHDKGEHSRW